MFISHTPVFIIHKRWRVIVVVGLIWAVFAALVSLLLPLEYRADAEVFIISKSRYGVDPYTVVRSAERVGENVAQVMTTNDFYEKVMATPGYSIDRSYFESADVSERVKRKRWQKALEPAVVFGTGALRISTYSVSSTQAALLAGAAADTLVDKGWEYVGGDVTFKVVNAPVVTRFPVRPNIFFNTVLGFIIGVLAMAVVVIRKDRWGARSA